MRIASILIHTFVFVVLMCIWYFAGNYCCYVYGKIQDGCDLSTVGGISSFAEISFALNTSIAIDWIKKQFMASLDGFAKRSMIKKSVKSSRAKITDKSTKKINERINTLKDRFGNMMRWPARVYTFFGVFFSFGIVVLLFSGIPVSLKRYVILFPFPAIAFYLTSFLVGFHIIESFDSFLHDDQDGSAKEDANNAVSDADYTVLSAKKSSKYRPTLTRTGRMRKMS